MLGSLQSLDLCTSANLVFELLNLLKLELFHFNSHLITKFFDVLYVFELLVG